MAQTDIQMELTGEVNDDRFGSQDVSVTLRVLGDAALQDDRVFVGINLGGSRPQQPGRMPESPTMVHPAPSGRIRFDETSTKGYYLDEVDVTMWIGESPENPSPLFQLHLEDPDASQSNMTGGFDISTTFGVDASLGMTGETPGASVGANMSQTSSYHHESQEFVFSSSSNGTLFRHAYFMTLTGDGSHYKGPNSLVATQAGSTSGAQLHELPLLAKSNHPIFSKAIWRSVDGRTDEAVQALQQGSLSIGVRIEADLVICEATNNFFDVATRTNIIELIWDQFFPVSLPAAATAGQ